jgi:8-oxo-dGTP diphosphatase
VKAVEEKIFGEKIEGIQYKERAGVYGIAFNGEWHIALVNTPRGYSLPGGGIEPGESHEECIKFLYFPTNYNQA